MPPPPPPSPCCAEPQRVCCDGSCFSPNTVFLVPCDSNLCGCPDEENLPPPAPSPPEPPTPPRAPDECCTDEAPICCITACITEEQLRTTRCSPTPNCCDEPPPAPPPPPPSPCCAEPQRVCCDGSCFSPNTVFLVPCDSNLCGCPDEENSGVLPPP